MMNGNKDNIGSKSLFFNPLDRGIIDSKSKADQVKQTAVEEYNKNILEVDEAFKNKIFVNNTLIVRLFKDDYIFKTNMSESIITDVKKVNTIYVETEGGKSAIIDNPLPYLFRGVVVAMSADVEDYFPELQIGDVVELENFNIQNSMYYPDKSKVDPIIPVSEIIDGINPYKNYNGYVKISPRLIEAIIK